MISYLLFFFRFFRTLSFILSFQLMLFSFQFELFIFRYRYRFTETEILVISFSAKILFRAITKGEVKIDQLHILIEI